MMFRRNKKENMTAIDEPAELDILCGKDKTYSMHPGNVKYHQLIASFMARYQIADTKQAKMKITREIVSHLQSKYGCRFIKAKGADWVEIPDQVARDKVSHALRFANRDETAPKKPRRRRTTAIAAAAPPKKTHRRGAPVNTSFSSQDTTSTVYSQMSVETARAMTAGPTGIKSSVDALYERQQAILSRIQEDNETADASTAEGDFNTLRSDDLNELLSQPLFASSEWDQVIEMAI